MSCRQATCGVDGPLIVKLNFNSSEVYYRMVASLCVNGSALFQMGVIGCHLANFLLGCQVVLATLCQICQTVSKGIDQIIYSVLAYLAAHFIRRRVVKTRRSFVRGYWITSRDIKRRLSYDHGIGDLFVIPLKNSQS